MDLAPAARRLFAHEDLDPPGPPAALVIGRLLEDGDGADLAWLFASAGEERAADWYARRGGRQLSRRSRAFWGLVLGREPGPAAAAAGELWPL